MDFQYWLYIIIGIIYLLSQFRKKPEDQENDIPTTRPERRDRGFDQTPEGHSPERQLTFEELLREITEGKKPVREEPREFQPSKRYAEYEEAIEEEEAQSLEQVTPDYRNDSRAFETYEKAKRQVPLMSSAERSTKIADIPLEPVRFKGYEKKSERNLINDYLTDFKDPEGLKKAIVMSEILQRKF